MTVLYLLDANVLIDANRDYYPIERVPEFWEWLAEMGRLGVSRFHRNSMKKLSSQSRNARTFWWIG